MPDSEQFGVRLEIKADTTLLQSRVGVGCAGLSHTILQNEENSVIVIFISDMRTRISMHHF